MFASLRPFLFRLDPEAAHTLTLRALALLPPGRGPAFDPILETRIAGLVFPSPVGLAAGFDKDARVWRQMLGLGFGFGRRGRFRLLGCGRRFPTDSVPFCGCSRLIVRLDLLDTEVFFAVFFFDAVFDIRDRFLELRNLNLVQRVGAFARLLDFL